MIQPAISQRFIWRVYWLIAGLSCVYFAWLISGGTWLLIGGQDAYGLAYNAYYQALIQGGFDVPMRVIGLEGHYAADGTTYVYYGALPAVLRGLLAPFVDLSDHTVARLMVWAMVCASGLVMQGWLRGILGRYTAEGIPSALLFLGAVCAVWLASPLMILASNAAIFHEPVACGFLASLLTLRLLNETTKHKHRHRWQKLLLAAIIAGVSVHARPHVAIGLYAAVGLMALVSCLSAVRVAQYRSARAYILPLVMLGLLGGSYLCLNSARFGNPLTWHGEQDGAVTYGYVFLGVEAPDSPRFQARADDGAFNFKRILPNSIYYLIGGWSLHDHVRQKLDLGFIRLESPHAPVLFLWLPWLICACWGLLYLRRDLSRPASVLAYVAALVPFLLTLSYMTVTHRYKVELFPLIWLLALLGLGAMMRHVGDAKAARSWLMLVVAGAFSLSAIIYNVLAANTYATRWDIYPHVLSAEECAQFVSQVKTTDVIRPDFCSLEGLHQGP